MFNFVETPRKFIIAELSIRKLGSSSVLIIRLFEYGITAIAKHAGRSGYLIILFEMAGEPCRFHNYDGVFFNFSAIRFTQTAGLNVWSLVVAPKNIQSNFE